MVWSDLLTKEIFAKENVMVLIIILITIFIGIIFIIFERKFRQKKIIENRLAIIRESSTELPQQKARHLQESPKIKEAKYKFSQDKEMLSKALNSFSKDEDIIKIANKEIGKEEMTWLLGRNPAATKKVEELSFALQKAYYSFNSLIKIISIISPEKNDAIKKLIENWTSEKEKLVSSIKNPILQYTNYAIQLDGYSKKLDLLISW